jgi:hypothetical protein
MVVALNNDLTGLGVPVQLAELIGAPVNALTCTGTSQTTGATVISRNTELVTAASSTAAVLPSTAKVMNPYFFTNQQTTAGLVFVPSGHTLNGTVNLAVTVAANGGSAIVWQYKVKNWTFK